MQHLRRGFTVAMAFILLTPGVAFASHYRYGNNSWQPGLSANTIDFQVSEAWRRSAFFGSGADGKPVAGDAVSSHNTMAFGDGTSTSFDLLVTSVDPANDWMFGVGLDPARPAGDKTDTAIGHTYPRPGTYTMVTEGCCRVGRDGAPSWHVNNPDLDQRVETTVNVGTGNRAPVSTLPPVVGCPTNAVCSFTVPASDSDGDRLRYRFSTPSEAASFGFVQPGAPHAPNNAAVDATTGLYTWDTTGATMGPAGTNTLYSTQVTIEDLDAQGQVKSKTAVDFLIHLGAVTGNPPVFDHPPTPACGSNLEVNTGSTLSFALQASDADPVSSVTLNVAGLPVGASMTPALPTTGNPVSSTFSWTPTAAQEGNHVVTFTATDNTGQQVLCSLTLSVTRVTALVAIDDVIVAEGDGGTVAARFTVSLSPAANAPVTVHYATTDGTATAPQDYLAQSGTVAFAPGQVTATVDIAINGDLVDEPNETFLVNLSGAVNAVISDPQGVGTIVDDDRNGAFACRASSLRSGATEPYVANAPYAPCVDGAAGAATALLSGAGLVSLTADARVLGATTDQTPDDLESAPPAAGESGTAQAGVEEVTIVSGTNRIVARTIVSQAKAECVEHGGALLPTLSSSSTLTSLVVNGVAVNVNGSRTIALGSTLVLKVNEQLLTPNSVTQRGLRLSGLFIPTLVVAEARAGFSGNPCAQ